MSTAARYRPEATGWFTSTRTNNGNQCVEVRFDGAAVHIRDSKFRRDPARRGQPEPIITVTADEWMAFLGVVLGRAAGPAPALAAVASDAGGTVLRRGGVELGYTAGEWSAFVAGARDGEFDRVPASA